MFSISAATTPTLVAGDSCTDVTSLATGTVVLVNAARTQILIKGIVGSFGTGDVVKKTLDPTVTVTLSNNGDSPIVEIDPYASAAPDGATVITGWTVDSTHYVSIYVPTSERHSGVYSTSKYRIEVTNNTALENDIGYTRIDGIQVKVTGTTGNYYKFGIYLNSADVGGQRLYNSIAYADTTGSADTFGFKGINNVYNFGTPAFSYIKNCVAYGWRDRGGYGGGVSGFDLTERTYAYNNTAYDNTWGFHDTGDGSVRSVLKNNISQSVSVDGYVGSWDASSDSNCSDVAADAPGSNPQTGTVTFAGAGDYHLSSSDTVAKSKGTNLSADANFPFTDDIDSQTRGATWDIGADQTPAPGNYTRGLIIN